MGLKELLERINRQIAEKTPGNEPVKHNWSPTSGEDVQLSRQKRSELETLAKEAPGEILSTLITLLSGTDPTCRDWASNTIKFLGKRASPAIPDLIQLLCTRDYGFLRDLSDILNGLGPQGKEALLNAIGDRRSDVRRGAVRSLRFHPPGNDDSVTTLLQILKDRKVGMREAAAESLGSVAGARGVSAKQRKSAIAELTRLLTDLSHEESTWMLRKAAIESLSTLAHFFTEETAVAIPAVIENLQDQMTENTAMSALAGFGRIAVPALIHTLKTGNSNLRAKTAQILGQMGDAASEAGPALIEALDDPDDNLRCRASSALSGMGTVSLSAATHLIEAFDDSNECVRENAAFALARMNARVVPMLIRSLKDKRPLIREGACLALQYFPAWEKEQAIPYFEVILRDDPEHKVRFRAAQALCAASESEARKLPDELVPTAPDMEEKAFFKGDTRGIVFVRFVSESPLFGVLVKENSGYALRCGYKNLHHNPDLLWDLTLEGAPVEKCRRLVNESVHVAGIKLKYRFLVREILRDDSHNRYKRLMI